MTAAESVNEEAVEAMRRTREFMAGAAFGIPEGDDSSDDPRRRDPGGDYLAALLAAAVPHLERRIRESIAGEDVALVLEAVASYLDTPVAAALSSVPGHLRWLAERPTDGVFGQHLAAARIARGSSS